MSRRLKIFAISTEAVENILLGSTGGKVLRVSGIPEDAKLIETRLVNTRWSDGTGSATIEMKVESREFPLVPDGARIPDGAADWRLECSEDEHELLCNMIHDLKEESSAYRLGVEEGRRLEREERQRESDDPKQCAEPIESTRA